MLLSNPKFSISRSIRTLGLLTLGCATACGTARSVKTHYPADNPDLPFSSAVEVDGTIYVAGHLGVDPATGTVPEDPLAEANMVLDRFAATLAKVGVTMDDLVQVQVFCSDVDLYAAWNEAYGARFDRGFPCRAFIGSGPLLRGAKFEMQGIAHR